MGALFGFHGRRHDALLRAMDDLLCHRGPHAELAPGTHYSFGMRSPHGPESAAGLGCGVAREGNTVLVLAGRLTNIDEWPAPAPPHILAAWARQGPAVLERLRGQFILLHADPRGLTLARDGAGVKTVYYALHARRLLFAGEPKAILRIPGFPRRIRPAGVARYLSFSFQPGHETLVEDLFELPAGHLLHWSGEGEPRLERWFRFEANGDRPVLSDEEWVERFRATFARAVTERIPPEGRTALFLSGGIDSSVVAAELARQQPSPLRTFAIHFGEQYPNELAFARMVAERIGAEHEEVLIRPRDFLPRLRQTIWHLDDAIGDPVTMPNFELSRRVAGDVQWVFNGEGGDPLFGGPKNMTMLLHHWYGGVAREHNFRERQYLASYRRGYEELGRLLSPQWRALIDPARDLEALLTPFFAAEQPESFLDKLMAINIRLKGAHLILPKVERMTGAWGLTPLAPLFDERLIRLSFQMPPRLKLIGGVEKWVLKRAYAADLPEPVITRPKSGMRVPVHFWFQGEMKAWARTILSPRDVRRVGIFDPDRVRQLLRYEIEEGPGRYGLRLWMLITFEIWRRLFIEGEQP